MGRLAGSRYRDVAARLTSFGFEPSGKQRGSHVEWVNRTARRQTIVPKHTGDIPEGTLRSILRQAGIAVDDFLA